MPGDVCSVVDWGATKDLKKKLLEQGINIRTADNPNGIPYFIYYDYDWCIIKSKVEYRKVSIINSNLVTQVVPMKMVKKLLTEHLLQ